MENTLNETTTLETGTPETATPETATPKAPEYKKFTRDDHLISTTKMLVEAIEQDKAPWQSPESVEKIGGLPIRHGRNEPFKGFNAIVLMTTAITKGYEDPRWLTPKDAKDFNVTIKKGEKAAYIETTDFHKRDEHGNKIVENGKPVLLDKPKVSLTPVFNVGQFVQNQNLQRLIPAAPFKPKEPDLALAEKIVQNCPAKIQHTLKPGERPSYNGWQDIISMPPQESFASKEGYYAELLHQISHSTGHKDRGNRSNVLERVNTPRNNQEELGGEIASFLLRLDTGLKLEPSHQKEHENVKKFIRIDCFSDEGQIIRKHNFAIAASEAERMKSSVLALERAQEQTQTATQTQTVTQEKFQEKLLEQFPTETLEKSQEETLKAHLKEHFVIGTIPTQSYQESSSKSKHKRERESESLGR